jgi:hypothetical protein
MHDAEGMCVPRDALSRRASCEKWVSVFLQGPLCQSIDARGFAAAGEWAALLKDERAKLKLNVSSDWPLPDVCQLW